MSSEFSKFVTKKVCSGGSQVGCYPHSLDWQDRRFDCGGEMLAASRWQSRCLVTGSRFKKFERLEKKR